MSELLRVLTGLCLLHLLAVWMLPEGDTAGYVDFAAGLLTMLCLLRSLMRLLGRGL